MRSYIRKREEVLQRARQERERFVLRGLERAVVRPLELYAHRKIIASAPAAPGGSARVPRAAPDRNELHETAIAAHKKMRGNPQPPQSGEIRIGRLIQPVRKEPLDRIAAEPPGGKADRMHHQEGDRHPRRALIAVWGRNVARSANDAVGQYGHAASSGSRISSRCMR